MPGNKKLMIAMLGKRSSNAAGPWQDKRDKRQRTRSAARRAAVADQSKYRP